MKKIVSLLLSLCLCAALCVPALAWPQNYAECWDYVSWVRDGSLDERNNPFEADKKITMLGWDIENEVPTSNEENYEYVASDTSWTVKNTGTGNYYIWIYAGSLFRMDDGSYDDDGGMSLRESGFADRAMDEEEFEGVDYKIKRLYPGESVTISFDQLIAREVFVEDGNVPAILDKGDGQYLYPLYIHMEFPDENDASAWLCKNFMWNEAEVQRMKAELGGGQASNSPVPAPDNAEPKPDSIPPETNSPEPETSGKQFADVLNTAYYYNAVYWALRQNITEGTTDTTFSPNDACVRAQVLTFIWRYAGKPEPTVSNPFHDVSADNYYKAALWAYEKGMVSGTAFNGDTPCTRAAAVTYLWILAGRPDTPIAGNTMFADTGSMEHPEAVAYAMEKGITKGTTETTFSPDRICTRAHIVTFLNRYEQQFKGV